MHKIRLFEKLVNKSLKILQMRSFTGIASTNYTQILNKTMKIRENNLFKKYLKTS